MNRNRVLRRRQRNDRLALVVLVLMVTPSAALANWREWLTDAARVAYCLACELRGIDPNEPIPKQRPPIVQEPAAPGALLPDPPTKADRPRYSLNPPAELRR